MILEFLFEYRADNEIFEYLLRFYTKDFTYKLKKENENYLLQISASEDELKSFLARIELIPNSVFLRSFDVRMLDENANLNENSSENLNSNSNLNKNLSENSNSNENLNLNENLNSALNSQIILSENLDENLLHNPPNFALLSHQNSNAYLKDKSLIDNEFNHFLELSLSFDELNFTALHKENFKENLEKALIKLKNNEAIFLKNHRGVYKLQIFNNDFKNADFLLATNPKAINSIFVCNNEKLKLLASLEKPIISTKLSAILRTKLGLDFSEFELKLSENLFSFALCEELFKDEIKFLSVKKILCEKADFKLLCVENEILITNGFDFLNPLAKRLIFSKDDLNFARISYLISRFKNALIMELSLDYDDFLIINNEESLLSFNLPKNSNELYESIRKDEIGAKLLSNFANNYPLLNEEFNGKSSFFTLFCIIGRILNLDLDFKKAGEKLISLSDNSRLMRGVKIDFIKENQVFNHTKTIRSVMSFMLAGVDEASIAYGVIESLAYFLRDIRDEFEISQALISGSLFESKTLLKNSLKHIKNCKLSDVATRI